MNNVRPACHLREHVYIYVGMHVCVHALFFLIFFSCVFVGLPTQLTGSNELRVVMMLPQDEISLKGNSGNGEAVLRMLLIIRTVMAVNQSLFCLSKRICLYYPECKNECVW